jgi:Cu-Zn family superoxide dismutase
MKVQMTIAGLALLGLVSQGCGGEAPPTVEPVATALPPAATETHRRATAYIDPLGDSGVEGSAIFVLEDGKITLQLDVSGMPPGPHAVHLHEHGDCSAPDGSSAGAHWNPSDEAHGRWGAEAHHLGDIGNIEIAPDGRGSYALTTDRWEMGTGSANDIVGRSVIIHAAPDDFATQPTGAAGGRIGCGVVQLD